MYCFDPPMSAVMVGKAVVMIATSRAEMKASKQSAENIPQNRKVFGVVCGAGFGSVDGVVSC